MTGGTDSTDVSAARDRYLAAALLADRADAADVVGRLLAAGVPPQDLIVELLAPVQRTVGDRWEAARCSVGQEHAVTSVTDAVLSSLTVGFEPPPRRGHLLLACAEGEHHALAARMAAELWILAGWRVTFLGAPLPAAHLARVLDDLDGDVVAISCTLTANLLGAVRSVAAARAAGWEVAVGGRAIGGDRDRAARVGATAWLDGSGELVPLAPLPNAADGLADALERAAGALADQAGARLARLGLVPADPVRRAELAAALEDAARVVAAALALDDPGLVDEHARWTARSLYAHGHPSRCSAAAWDALADAAAGHPAEVRSLLRRGAAGAGVVAA